MSKDTYSCHILSTNYATMNFMMNNAICLVDCYTYVVVVVGPLWPFLAGSVG